MEFVDFMIMSKKIVDTLSSNELKKSNILKNIDTNKKNIEELKMLGICKCFKMIFPNYYRKKLDIKNEYFLDWTTPTEDYIKDDLIIVTDDSKNTYSFLFDEIINIFHNNLSRSNAEIEPQYNICTVTKSFRLPVNPYSNLSFSLNEMKQIISQILLYNKKMIQYKEMPEIYHFLKNYEIIIKDCENLSNYFVTDYLFLFFKKKGLIYKEKTKIKTKVFCDNFSKWQDKKMKNIDFYKFLFQY
jgi:hypothetical protein